MKNYLQMSLLWDVVVFDEIVKRSGVERSKVSAVKNGALSGISSDLFIKIIVVTGAKLTLKMAS